MNGGPVHVVLVDPDGRLQRVTDALSADSTPFACTVVEEPAAVPTVPAPDVVIVHHASGTAEHDAIDGLAQYRTVDSIPEDTPIAVYSTESDIEFVDRALDAGVDGIIGVPPDRAELLVRRVRAICEEWTPSVDRAQLLDSLLHSFPHQFFFKDTHGRFVALSQESEEQFHLDRSALIGRTDFSLFDTELARELYAEEQRIMDTGEPIVEKVEHFVEDGKDKWVSTTKAPWYDASGDVVGTIGSTRDVSPQKRREQLVRTLYESSPDILRAATKREVASIVAGIVEEKDSFPPAQVAIVEDGTLQPVAGTPTAQPYSDYGSHYERTLRAGAAQYLSVDGQLDAAFPEENAAGAAFFPLGEHGVVGFVPREGIISEAHEELMPVFAGHVTAALDGIDRERLAHQNEQLEEFASIVSHDLRNPLNIASGRAELLAQSVDSPHVERLREALTRMDDLIDELLTLAKQGQTVENTSAVDLAACAEQAWDHVETAGSRLVCETAASIVANESRLVSLFENLFRNAVEHNIDPVTVRVEASAEGFSVADDGRGVSTADRERLFEMGFSGADGTGYGLYIVESIAEAHDWDIDVTDGIDGGARFEFTGVTVTAR